MLSEQQIRQFQQNGYVNGGPVLTADEVEILRAEVMRVIAERDRPDVTQPILCRNLTGDDDAPVWQIVNIWQASPPFREVMAHPAITKGISQLTGARELRIWHDQIQN
ncbi:MAG: hypothetical protein KDE34_16750, partial [Anaerolineales bacterium]|nr:hypothetical protein [Anaerolineales bacterium]